MAQDGPQHPLDLIGRDKFLSTNSSQGLGGPVQGDRCTRASPQGHVLVFAGRLDQLDYVVPHLVIDLDRTDRLLTTQDFVD